MRLPALAHVAVADGMQFTLYRNAGTEQDRELVEVDTALAGASAHHAGPGDTFRQNAEAGHAAAVAEALNAAVLGNRIKHLVIIADPSTLGEMRKLYHKQLEAALIGDMAKTLTGHSSDHVLRAVAAA